MVLLLLPSFSFFLASAMEKNNNKILYCDAECNVPTVNIHCIHSSQGKHDRGLDLGWAPGAAYQQTLWGCLGFFCWSHVKKCAKRKCSQCLKLLHTHRQAVGAVANGQSRHNSAGQTRKSRMACSDFSAGWQKRLIKAWGYAVRCGVRLGNPSKPPGLDVPPGICETVRK